MSDDKYKSNTYHTTLPPYSDDPLGPNETQGLLSGGAPPSSDGVTGRKRALLVGILVSVAVILAVGTALAERKSTMYTMGLLELPLLGAPAHHHGKSHVKHHAAHHKSAAKHKPAAHEAHPKPAKHDEHKTDKKAKDEKHHTSKAHKKTKDEKHHVTKTHEAARAETHHAARTKTHHVAHDTKAHTEKTNKKRTKKDRRDLDCNELLTGVFVQECIADAGTSVGAFAAIPTEDGGIAGLGASGRRLSIFDLGPLDDVENEPQRMLKKVNATDEDASADKFVEGDIPGDSSADVNDESGSSSSLEEKRKKSKRKKTSEATEDGTVEGSDSSSGDVSDEDGDNGEDDYPEDASEDVDASEDGEDEEVGEEASEDEDASEDEGHGEDASEDEDDGDGVSEDEEDEDEEPVNCIRTVSITSDPSWIAETSVAKYNSVDKDEKKILWSWGGDIGMCSFRKLNGRECRVSLNKIAKAFKDDFTVELKDYSHKVLC